MIRKRERESEFHLPLLVTRLIATFENEINQILRGKEKTRREIYIEWKKKIFSIMRHHQPGVIISWTFISRQDNKCPVAQLFLTNLPIVFHPPPEHRLPVFNVFPSFPALPRFLSFFSFSFPSLLFSLPSFSLAFERNKGGGRWRWYV